MKFLDSIEIQGEQVKRIELYQGDVTVLSADEGFDLLFVSTFPNDYTPTNCSLIGALDRKGLSVAALAMNKDVDLRETFSCWLSNEFTPQDRGLRFKRIICFEQLIRGNPPELVGDVFRALIPILAEKPDIKTLGLSLDAVVPIGAADNGPYSISKILMPLLEAACHWLAAGLSLRCIKLVISSQAQSQEGHRVFLEAKSNRTYSSDLLFGQSKGESDSLENHFAYFHDLSRDVSAHGRHNNYDVFISYSRANTNESEALEQALRDSRPDIRIFVDRKEIDIGAAWQPEIFENLDKCRKVVALLSPDYLSSKMCKEEYNIAWIRSRENDEDLIFPVYLYTAALPTYMKYRNYFDCREGDKSKIVNASKKLLAALENPKL